MIIVKWQRKHLTDQMTPFIVSFVSLLNQSLGDDVDQKIVFNFSKNTYKKKSEIWEGTIYIYVRENELDDEPDLMQLLATTASMFGMMHLAKLHPESIPGTNYDTSSKQLVVNAGWPPSRRRAYVEMFVTEVFRKLGITDPTAEYLIDAADDLYHLYHSIVDERESHDRRELSGTGIVSADSGRRSGSELERERERVPEYQVSLELVS